MARFVKVTWGRMPASWRALGIGTAGLMLLCMVSWVAASPDSDGDGMPDDWEVAHQLDQFADDAAMDGDADALCNLQEYGIGTDPNAADSDFDGAGDRYEYLAGTDPLDDASTPTGPVTLVVPEDVTLNAAQTLSPERTGEATAVAEGDDAPAISCTDRDNTLGIGLLLNLHLDEGAGATIAMDGSGFGRDGAIVGATSGVVGVVGAAAQFDGIDDAVVLGSPAGLDGTGSITVAAWVAPDAIDNTRTIVAHGPTATSVAAVLLRIHDGQYQAVIRDGAERVAAAPVPAEDLGSWVHLAATCDGDSWTLYRNGAAIARTVCPGGVPTVDAAWTVGADATGHHFAGSIDELAVWNRPLPPFEVAFLHAMGASGRTSLGPARQLGDAVPTIVSLPITDADGHTDTIDIALGTASRVTVCNTAAKRAPGDNRTTLSFNAGASATKLIVAVSGERSGGSFTLTYDGVPLTQAAPARGRAAGIWYLDHPYTGGPADLIVDITSTNAANGIGIGVVSIADAAPGAGDGTAVAGNRVTVTADTANSLVVAAYGVNAAGGATSADAPLTQLYSGDIGSAKGCAGYHIAPPGPNTYSFISAATADPATAAAVFSPTLSTADGVTISRTWTAVADSGATASDIQTITVTEPDSDADGDRLSWVHERALGTDPTKADTDGDGLSDSEELQHATSPTNADTDADGLADSRELALGTNPLLADSDGDGHGDRYEHLAGSDPCDAASAPKGPVTLNLPPNVILHPDQTISPELIGQATAVAEGDDSPTISCTDRDNTLGLGLRLNLHLDEGTAATAATDSSGFGHHGAIVGAAPGFEGVVATALRFDGGDDAIILGTPADLNIAGTITLAAWVMSEAIDNTRTIVACGPGADAALFLRIHDGQYQAGASDGADHLAAAPIPAEDLGSWVHLVATCDGDSWTLYRNGAAIARTVCPGGVPTVDAAWTVGADATGHHFAGRIDELAIWNRPLPAFEVAFLHTMGASGRTSLGPARSLDNARLTTVSLPLTHADGHLETIHIPLAEVHAVSVLNAAAKRAPRQDLATLSFDAGAAATKLVVTVAGESSSGSAVVTYHGVPLTRAAPDHSRTRGIWYLDQPYTGGPADLTVDCTAIDTVNGLGIGVVSLAGTAPGVETSAAVAANSIAIPTAAPDSAIVANYAVNAAGATAYADAPLTQLYSGDIGSARASAGYRIVPTPGTNTCAFSSSDYPGPATAAAVFSPPYTENVTISRTWTAIAADGSVASATQIITVIHPDSDADGDRLSWVHERALGTDPAKADTDDDGLADAQELQYAADPHIADTDTDGILDGREVAAGSDPTRTDTDTDGFSDYEELIVIHSDPAAADFDGTVTELAAAQGSTGTVVNGTWHAEGPAIVAQERCGTLDYLLAIPAAGTYRLAVSGTQANKLTDASRFILDLRVDGAFVDTICLDAPAGNIATATAWLPHLAAGQHTLSVTWRNVETDTYLAIHRVAVQQLNGADTDQDGTLDWQQSRLDALTGLYRAPATNPVSPVCIEGLAFYPDLVDARSSFVPDDTTLPIDDQGLLINPVRPSLASSFYANIPLAPNAPTQLTVTYQNHAAAEQLQITWTPTNIHLLDAPVTIRQWDALLITGHPEGATAGAITIDIEGNPITTTVGAPVPYTFENPGPVPVTVTWTPQTGAPVTAAATVNVVRSRLAADPACIVGLTRPWSCPHLAPETIVEADSHLRMRDVTAPGAQGRDYTLELTEDRPARIIARLGEDGPLLDAADALNITYYASATEERTVVQTFPDGGALVECFFSFSQIPDAFTIDLIVIVGGVTFDDGTTFRTLTAADFDALGNCRYRMIMPPGTQSSNCHGIRIYQDGTLLRSH